MFPKGVLKINQKNRRIEGVSVKDIGYLNVPFLKIFTIKMNLQRTIKKILKKEKVNSVMSFNYLSAYKNICFKYPPKFKYNYIPILADLPIKHTSRISFISRFKVTISNHIQIKQLKKIKLAILLNSNAKQMISQDAKFIVIEGGVKTHSPTPQFNATYSKKVFLYSGTLDEYSGVNLMVDALIVVSRKHPEVSLEIYGFGDYQDYISQLSLKNSNINFMRTISRENLLQRQKSSFCLINPKQINHPVSIMTFPSKLHEYMLSMRPILSTRLKGIDEKYFENMIIIEGDELKDYVEGFNKVLDSKMEDLNLTAKKAYNFIVNEKNWKAQITKILNFLNEI